jgi:hypothetical protein
MAETEELLRFLVQLTARHVFPEEALRQIIGSSGRQVEAYNLCDGTRTQAEIVKVSKLDQGQFSRTAGRWAEAGVLFRVGTGRDVKLLHLYPISSVQAGRKKKDDAD